VLVLALIVFGPAKLPELMGSVGRAIREFQRASQELTQVFQETQQEFESALNVDEAPAAADTTASGEAAAEAEPVIYQEPAEEATVAEPEPVVVSHQPEEFETAAAMLDPVEPFPVPAEPEPVPAEPEPVPAVAAAPKPKRVRRKKAEAEPVAAEPLVELTTTVPAEDAGLSEPAPLSSQDTATAPTDEVAATAPTAGVGAGAPLANGVEPYGAPLDEPPNGVEPAPSPRRRRRASVTATAPEESP
jgi:TatA/E family protein of Tat protein translocase